MVMQPSSGVYCSGQPTGKSAFYLILWVDCPPSIAHVYVCRLVLFYYSPVSTDITITTPPNLRTNVRQFAIVNLEP